MNFPNLSLMLAGIIGGGTALIHGYLMQRRMVEPINRALAVENKVPTSVRRLIPALLHLSTAVWLLGGAALVMVGFFEGDQRLLVGLFVGATFLYGAVANFWATRGRHPGWMLMAAALFLIAIGLSV